MNVNWWKSAVVIILLAAVIVLVLTLASGSMHTGGHYGR